MDGDLTTAMAAVRRSFKDYASCRVQRSLGLRLPLDKPEIERERSRVKHLFKDLQYLGGTVIVHCIP